MWLADSWKDYEVLDTSAGEKLERWGNYILVRPDPQVIWNTPKDDPLWRKYDARYARSSTGGGKWQNLRLPAQWQVRFSKRGKTENAYSQIKERKRNGKNENSAGQVL